MAKVVPLMYFSHAELKLVDNLDAKIEYTKPNIKQNRSNFESSGVDKKLKLTIEDEEMNYEAVEEDESPFMIGILDKKSREISVCDTPYFVMKPECYLGARSDTNQNLTVDQSVSYSEKLNLLTAAFGSSKKRKAMQTKLKNKIDSETLEKALTVAIEETKNNIQTQLETENNQEEEVNTLEQFSILPVPNKNAKTPFEVYDLYEILGITLAEFDRYTSEHSTKFATVTTDIIKKWQKMNVYSDYVCEHAVIISGSKSSHHYKLQKSKLLAYMNYLMMLYKLKSAQLRTKMPLNSSEVPDVVIKSLLEQYTVISSSNAQSRNLRTMPRRLKDKLICHILILALHIDDFVTNLDTFQKDLKLSIQKISDFFQALGCFVKNQVITTNGKKQVIKKAELKLPLNEANKLEPRKRSRKD